MTDTPKCSSGKPATRGHGLLAHYQIAVEAIDSEAKEQRAANLRGVAPRTGYPDCCEGKSWCRHTGARIIAQSGREEVSNGE